MLVDANGNPIWFTISDGTTYDVKVAPELINSVDLTQTESVSADKGYDSDELREQIKSKGAKANIPRKKNAKANNSHMDWYVYGLKHLVENAFAKLKHYRAISIRYDKLKQSFESTVALACLYLA